ncbi:MAG: methyltransferase domain-containing protein [Anaerolineales bacterium]|nr:methyltransferase domain-containing protein [Anaerolineales bacterium]
MLPNFLHLVKSFALARVLMSAIELDLFPTLQTEPLSRTQLLRQIGIADSNIANPFIEMLLAFEIIQERDGLLYLTPLSEAVLPVYESISSWNQEMLIFFRSLPDLTNVLRTGRYEETEIAHFWAYKQTADRANLEQAQVDDYSSAMDASQGQLSQIVADQYDFSTCDHVIDFGGGYGRLAFTLAEKYPNLKVTVADLPAVCEKTRIRIDALGLKDRVDTLPVDFFADELPTGVADAILFVRVLHDWNDEQAVQLLNRSRQCLRPSGKAIVVEPIMSDKAAVNPASAPASLMLALMGGKRRDVSEYTEFLTQAGYTSSSWRDCGLSIYKLIEAY